MKLSRTNIEKLYKRNISLEKKLLKKDYENLELNAINAKYSKLIYQNHQIILHPENNQLKDTYINPDSFKCAGIVVGVQRYFD